MDMVLKWYYEVNTVHVTVTGILDRVNSAQTRELSAVLAELVEAADYDSEYVIRAH